MMVALMNALFVTIHLLYALSSLTPACGAFGPKNLQTMLFLVPDNKSSKDDLTTPISIGNQYPSLAFRISIGPSPNLPTHPQPA
jgi:hypothetical protein